MYGPIEEIDFLGRFLLDVVMVKIVSAEVALVCQVLKQLSPDEEGLAVF